MEKYSNYIIKDNTGRDFAIYPEDIRKIMSGDMYLKFCKWIKGQACPIINNKTAVYIWDLQTYENKRNNGPTQTTS